MKISPDQNDDLFCQIGDYVKLKTDINTTGWPGEESESIKKDSVYEVINVVGYGFDLKLDQIVSSNCDLNFSLVFSRARFWLTVL